MDPRHRYLAEELEKKESEVSQLHSHLHETRAKFIQLEQAFKTNLQLQTRREAEFDHLKNEFQELRKLNADTLQARAELSSRLMNTVIERDHWKNTFLQQREFVMRNKIAYENAAASVKQECEDILMISRETTEKQFHELIELYNGTREKLIQLEEEVGRYQSCRREYENRTFELANLLETLNRFDVDVSSVCQLAAEALKNLTVPGNLFEGSMKNLRHITWDTRAKKDQTELVLLQKQNTVLKEIVKSLKKKIQWQTHNEVPEEGIDHQNCLASQETEIITRNCSSSLPDRLTFLENHTENKDLNSLSESDRNENRDSKHSNENKTMNTCGRVFCIESHSNGRLYEEYIFKLSSNREMKLKYPVILNNSETMVQMEFIDDETEYEKALLDRIIIFFKNIYASVNVKRTGVPCGTQTIRLKTLNRSTQTAVIGVKSFLRLNAGVTVSKQIYKFVDQITEVIF
ncbi:uncharacterized protein LOC116424175 [Nomia melanderi]|uniref:uncharacterized protein LOC116424175 n=1 Tax=Nomia melanderi TaxID=2448451 RepID=UPI003FCEA3F6